MPRTSIERSEEAGTTKKVQLQAGDLQMGAESLKDGGVTPEVAWLLKKGVARGHFHSRLMLGKGLGAPYFFLEHCLQPCPSLHCSTQSVSMLRCAVELSMYSWKFIYADFSHMKRGITFVKI